MNDTLILISYLMNLNYLNRIKGTKQPTLWLVAALWCCLAMGGCSDDDAVKQNPYLQAKTRAMLKEVVEVRFNNIDAKSEITIDFGDGTVEHGLAGEAISHAYQEAGDYTMLISAGQYEVQKRIRVYNLLALTEAMAKFKDDNYKTVWVMAHRGNTTDHTVPENSCSAVEASIENGTDIVECDVHRTLDGELVVCHNQTIDATTNGSGDITAMTLAQIKSYNLKDRNGRVTDETMPTLEEFLKAGRGKIYFNLDYSPRTASSQEVFEVVRKLDMLEQVFFYCNSSTKAEEILELSPKAQVYTWTGQHKPLIGQSGTYFVQYSYNTNGTSTALGTSITDGMLCSVNMLTMSGSAVSEYALNTAYLDDLFNVYPMVKMIQCDTADKLIPELESRGRR